MCFGGNKYEFLFFFRCIQRNKCMCLKNYASRTLWKTQTPHLADETLGRCIKQRKQTVTERRRDTNRFAGPILAVMRHADRVRIHKGTQWPHSLSEHSRGEQARMRDPGQALENRGEMWFAYCLLLWI